MESLIFHHGTQAATWTNPSPVLLARIRVSRWQRQHIEFFRSLKGGDTGSTKDLSDQGIQISNSASALSGAGDSLNLFNAENKQGKQSIINATNEHNSVPMVAVTPVSIQKNVGNNIGKTIQFLKAGGAVSKEHVAHQATENTHFSTPFLVGGNSYFSSPLNTDSNNGQFIPTAKNKVMNVQIPGTTSSGPMKQDTLSARVHGVTPSAPQQRFPSSVPRTSWNQARPISGLDINFPGGGLNGLQAVGNGRGTNYGGQFLRPGETWIRPWQKQLRSSPILASSMQMQPRPPQVDIAGRIPSPQWQGQGTAANGPVIVNASAMNRGIQTVNPVGN